MLQAALSEESYSWLQNAASVHQLWDSSISLLRTLEETLMPAINLTNCPSQVKKNENVGAGDASKRNISYEVSTSMRRRPKTKQPKHTSECDADGTNT